MDKVSRSKKSSPNEFDIYSHLLCAGDLAKTGFLQPLGELACALDGNRFDTHIQELFIDYFTDYVRGSVTPLDDDSGKLLLQISSRRA